MPQARIKHQPVPEYKKPADLTPLEKHALIHRSWPLASPRFLESPFHRLQNLPSWVCSAQDSLRSVP